MADFVDDARDAVNDTVDDVANETDDVVDDATDGGGNASTTSPTAEVTRLYDTIFDRAPDDAGLTFWTNSLRAGTSLDDVATLFVASPEFQDRYGDVSGAEFVNLLYQNVLDRAPDPEGQMFWTDSLVSGRADRDDIALAFSESPEHVAKIGPVSDAPFV